MTAWGRQFLEHAANGLHAPFRIVFALFTFSKVFKYSFKRFWNLWVKSTDGCNHAKDSVRARPAHAQFILRKRRHGLHRNNAASGTIMTVPAGYDSDGPGPGRGYLCTATLAHRHSLDTVTGRSGSTTCRTEDCQHQPAGSPGRQAVGRQIRPILRCLSHTKKRTLQPPGPAASRCGDHDRWVDSHRLWRYLL